MTNPIMLKLWIDSKKAQLEKQKDLYILYSTEIMDAKIQLLNEIIEDFNLEDVEENVDYNIHKNF
jgi:hypothetical protein